MRGLLRTAGASARINGPIAGHHRHCARVRGLARPISFPLSLQCELLLGHSELASLANALKSWQRHGLLDYAQERYLNIDGGDAGSRNQITGLARSHGFTVFTSETSQGISSALGSLFPPTIKSCYHIM
jgi:hypothetical protein